MNDKKLRELLAKLLMAADQYGTRSEEVKKIFRENKGKEFWNLGATLLVVMEEKNDDKVPGA